MTHRHHDEVLHAVSTAVCLLGQSGDMGIIGYCHSHAHPVA